MEKFSTAEFLVNVLSNAFKCVEYFRQPPPKGNRTNFFYITDRTTADINADDNGAYNKTRHTTKLYYRENGALLGVRKEGDRYYYNKKKSNRSCSRVYISEGKIVSVNRKYGKSKSSPLSKIIVTISNPVTDPTLSYRCVIYQLESEISETKEVLSHGNAKKDNAIDKSYYRTSRDVLYQTKTMVENGMSAKKVYDTINEQSGDDFTSVSQSNKLRDVKQVYREAASVKKMKLQRKCQMNSRCF